MTFGKSKLIDNRLGWHPLNFVREVETQCSHRKNRRCDTLKKRTCRGRKSLSPSVGDNHRLCVKFVSQESQIDHTTITKNNKEN